MIPIQIDHQYFAWLVSLIKIGNRRTYEGLFERMHNREFVWTVPNDDNRLADGVDLRREFFDGFYNHKYEPQDLVLEGATVLEVLVALSHRVVFHAGGDAREWAWHLIENLRLHKSSDPLTEAKANRVDEILEDLIWRTYERNGQGGFFPLNEPKEDQTKVEISYQMNAYVMEINQEP